LVAFSAPATSARRANQETKDQALDLPMGLPEDVEKAAILLAAEDQRDLTVHLLQLTDSEDAAIRARAALAIGRIGVPAGMEQLLQMCSDPDARVRALAAFGAGLIELDIVFADQAAVLRQRASEVLIGLLGDPSTEVVTQAIRALGKLADGGAVGPLGDLLAHADAVSPRVTVAALSAWWRLPGVSSDPAVGLLGFPDADVRLAAAHAVRRLDDPNARPALVPLLDDADSLVRAMALRGLRAAPANVATAQGIRMLGDDDWRVVAEALAWLQVAWGEEDWRPDDASVYAVIRASMEHNVHLRRMALGVLAHVAGDWPVAEDVLEQALLDPEAAVRAACLEAYAAAGRDAARGVLSRLRQLYRGASRLTEGTGGSDEVTIEDLQPVEAIALVRVLAAAEDDTATAWLELLGTQGPLAAQIEVLQEWRVLDAQWAARRVQELLLSPDAILRGVAAEVVPSLQAAGIGVPGTEGAAEDWVDLLWRVHLEMQGSRYRDPYLQVLAAIQDVDADMFGSRASIFYGSADRVVRLWTFRLMQGHIGSGNQRRPIPDSMGEQVRGPQQTGRTDAEYRAMAEEILRLQTERPRLVFVTRRGEFEVELLVDAAPLTTLAYRDLAAGGFFDGILFHRVVPAFVAQAGDPTATGQGSAAITLRNEESPVPYTTGTVGLALSGRDTGSSQFFIVHGPQPHLQGVYPVFGRVIRGQRSVERVQPGDAILVGQ
jgi:cyclophilin family peptidyl-prolyl cis-trans isomerase/HEAT repeat protein